VDIRRCGYQALWISGVVDIRRCGYQALWISGVADIFKPIKKGVINNPLV
jgi:hypothetical protein